MASKITTRPATVARDGSIVTLQRQQLPVTEDYKRGDPLFADRRSSPARLKYRAQRFLRRHGMTTA